MRASRWQTRLRGRLSWLSLAWNFLNYSRIVIDRAGGECYSIRKHSFECTRVSGETEMVAETPESSVGREAPVCEETFVHVETVARLRPNLEHIAGAAELFKALGDETRLKVVYALAQAELCVCDVAAVLGASQATASYHLRLLHHLGLARYRREGKLVYYRLADPGLAEVVASALRYPVRR